MPDAQLQACGRLCRAEAPRLLLGMTAGLQVCSARVDVLAQGLKLWPAPTLSRNAEHAAVLGRPWREAGLEPRAGLLPSGERGEEDVAPGPACSEKSNLGRDPQHGGPPMAQTFLCIVAGRRRQLAQPVAEAARERGTCLEWSRVSGLRQGAILCREALGDASWCSDRVSLPSGTPACTSTQLPSRQGLPGSLLQWWPGSRNIRIHAGKVNPCLPAGIIPP